MQRIAVHPLTHKFADVTEHLTISHFIIEDISLGVMDDCTKSIFNNQSDKKSCTQENLEKFQQEVIPLYESTALLFNGQSSTTSIICGATTINVSAPAAVFNSQICIHHPIQIQIQSAVDITIRPSLMNEIDLLTPHPQIDNLKEIIHNQWNGIHQITTGGIICTILGTSTIIMFFVIIVRCIKQSQQQDNWVPNWQGPFHPSTPAMDSSLGRTH